MYCIHCGVRLADTEARCPLCGTVPYHPDFPRPQATPLYPNGRIPKQHFSPLGTIIVATTLFLIPLLISFLCDLQINHAVTWSGYVIGSLLLGYFVFVLPLWFRKPNPIVFTPCAFALAGGFLVYINAVTDGDWFLSFAFPVTGFFSLLVTTVVVLVRCLRRGHLYIYGGAFLALGVFMPLLEFLVELTFAAEPPVFWSLYPMVALVLLGGMLIFLAICRPARESMERKFFL